ncbi:MAG: hypothetical protein U0359_05195 [Byssovorax sp.]
MRRALPWVMVIAAATGCSGASAGKVAAAAITAGAAVAAAAINRAATKDCWASCPQGMRCEHSSGTCVPAEERSMSYAIPGPSEIPAVAPGADVPLMPDCRGLCFQGEECVFRDREPACVPIADGGAADGG